MSQTADIALRDPERFATLAFLSVRGVGPATCERLRNTFGSLAEALEAGPSRYLEVLRADAAESHGDPRKGASEILEYCARRGVDLIFRGDASWPTRFDELRGARPELVFVRGKLEVQRRTIGVVGTRGMTVDGEFAAHRLGLRFAEAGAITVSGGAVGIDASAHQGALEGKGQTWAVLGAGLEHMYPAENRELFEQIAANGALITESPPDHENKEGTFPRRNKLVAALSEALVIVEGDFKSGAMHTVRDAEKLRRPVFAVPGAPRNAKARAPNLLLRTGRAKICADSSDVLHPLGLVDSLKNLGVDQAPVYESIASAPAQEPLDASLEPALNALTRRERHFDELVSQVGWPAPQLLSALTQLELLGLCEQRPGKLFVRRSG